MQNTDIEKFYKNLPASSAGSIFDIIDEYPKLARSIGDIAQLRFVVDANFVADELSYKYKNPDCLETRIEELARSRLFEFHAPNWLISEVEFSVFPYLQKRFGFEVKKLSMIWEGFSDSLIIHPGYICPIGTFRYGGDPKDTPYIDLYRDICAIGILSKDRDISNMGAKRYLVDAMIVGQMHARSFMGSLSLQFLGTTVPVLSVNAIGHIVKGILQMWKQAPDWIKLLFATGLIYLFLKPSVRMYVLKKIKLLTNLGRDSLELVALLIELEKGCREVAEAKRQEMLRLEA